MVPHEVFRYCEPKKSKENRDMQKKFPRSETFWILEVVPRNFLRTVRQKILNEERDFPF